MPPLSAGRRFACLSLLAAAAAGCMFFPKRLQSTLDRPPTEAEMAELWVEPADVAARDLFYGPGGPELEPDPKARYEFVSKDVTGFSRGWDVRDPKGTEWSVKIGIEAQPEVVVSRIVWAVGYHQPPTYYVRDWVLTGSPEAGPQFSGRFRPDLPWLKRTGIWRWGRNPFVGTRPFRGLIVLMLVVNNWDLRDPNNIVYELASPREGAARWFVVRDLGASLGQTRFIPQSSRNDLEGFEDEGFIKGIVGGRVKFAYRGPHQELLRDITPEDVRWTCERLSRLTSRQWQDAFRAAGYEAAKSERYIRKIKEKIEQGRILGGGGGDTRRSPGDRS